MPAKPVVALLALIVTSSIAAQQPQTDDPIALSQRAGAAYAEGRFREAGDLYARMLQRIPRNVSVRVAYARALAKEQRVEDALRELEAAAAFGLRFNADDPAFDTIASHARFKSIVSKMRARSAPVVRSTTAFLLEKDLIPESVAFDRTSGAFYVGSMYKRKIVKIAVDGSVTDFIPSQRDGLFGVLGMKVDAEHGELWANSCNSDRPPMEVRDPATAGQAAIFRYDLGSGKLIRRYAAPRGDANAPFCFNDLVLAPNGDVYATTGGDGIYRLRNDRASSSAPRGERARPRASSARTAIESPTQFETFVAPDGSWFNGITISSDGKSIFAASHLDGVVRIDIADGKRTLIDVPPGVTLGAIDGLYFHEDSLVGVQGSDPSRVVRAWLNDAHTRVTEFAVLEQAHPISDFPLTGVVVGDDLYYIARSQLRSFDDNGTGRIWPMEKLKETVILKLPLEVPAATSLTTDALREKLLQRYRDGLRAHIELNADFLADGNGDEFLSASAGKISRPTRESTRKFFKSYFEGATYHEYADLEPPIVRISDDGSMGWVMNRIRVRRTTKKPDGKEEESSFVYAGLMIYERRGDEWVRVANASTFE